MDKPADLRDDGMGIDALRDWAGSPQAGRSPLVLLHRPDLLHQGRPRVQDGGLHRHHSGHLPPAEHGRQGPSHSPGTRSAPRSGSFGRSWTRWSSAPRAGWTTAANATSANPPAWRTPRPWPRWWKPVSPSERQGGDQQHRHHHRQPHRPRHRCPLLLRRPPAGLSRGGAPAPRTAPIGRGAARGDMQAWP